ncbi:MAG: glutathione S-transferase family protein [Paraglaciecola sp.]|uniref:glutathione S-transferase family protein n=2 Tax=Paraglaciecola sp. TaxID=1920173 RepID=UPI003264AB6B
MKHYYNPMSRALSTDWMLKELGVKHEQIIIDFRTDNKELRDFHKINPMGKVPTLIDGDRVITEVAAICAYLADKFLKKGLAPELGSNERADYYRYLFVAGNTIEPALTLDASGIKYPNPMAAGWGDMPRVLSTIELMTPTSNWALGEKFTAADVVFGGLLDSFVTFNLIKASPKVESYIARIRQRPCYQEAHAVPTETNA